MFNLKKIIVACSLFYYVNASYAQYNLVKAEKIPPMMEVLQVDNRESSTMVYIKYTRSKGIDWSNINEKTFARVNGSYKQYHLINSINMPISSEAEQIDMLFDQPNQVHCFALEFEKIPIGVTFDIIENEQNPNAYNIFGIKPDTTQITEFVNLDKMVEDYPITRERGMYLKNNILVQYVKANNIILTMYVQAIKQYGKYITVNMDLQNFSGKSILFTLNNVSAEGYVVQEGKPVKTIPLEVLSSYEYDKKVAQKQAWNNFWVALGEGMAAYNAGYSASSTTYGGNSYTSAYGHAYGYAGNTYGYVNAYGSAYTTTFGRSNTVSYSGAAAYAAQQQANANVRAYKSEQYMIRQQLNEGYIKNNTIKNQVEYTGFFNIKYKKIDHIKLDFLIDGILFPFIF
ncbi:MAG: sulfur globule family protein [Prevotella sp.]|nr:sulfur globule family protein [Prevotella sp.]